MRTKINKNKKKNNNILQISSLIKFTSIKYSYNNIYFKGLYNTLIIYPIANTKKIILYNEKS
ncbi:hypothetical protein PFTANZ_01185 [Plasmodium falciparum Tanzania (2000708)]|uniref:Uncharacterized protein n=1 Tax=Plasmodium falciparum Tanzania (2000708) TaxID=1036725 RepID=A0A024WCG8_PLAFA|nr:hypothetical protein PFTANZ_01185 [Plasmodium falciparum Tanzania (2000708)]